MPTVAMPINPSVIINIALRPILSPKCPKKAPPSGRNRKPTPNVAKADRVLMVGLSLGKNKRGGRRVDEEIVPFHDRPYEARESHLADRRRRVNIFSAYS